MGPHEHCGNSGIFPGKRRRASLESEGVWLRRSAAFRAKIFAVASDRTLTFSPQWAARMCS